MNTFERGDKVRFLASNPAIKPSLIDAATGTASSIRGMTGVILDASDNKYLIAVKRGVWIKGPDGVVRRLRKIQDTASNLKLR